VATARPRALPLQSLQLASQACKLQFAAAKLCAAAAGVLELSYEL
jgi:hypothetical protein